MRETIVHEHGRSMVPEDARDCASEEDVPRTQTGRCVRTETSVYKPLDTGAERTDVRELYKPAGLLS